MFAFAHVARLTTSWRSTTPGSGRPRCCSSSGIAQRHRARIVGVDVVQLGSAQRPRCGCQSGSGDLLDALPIDEPVRHVALRALREVARSDGQADACGNAHHNCLLIAMKVAPRLLPARLSCRSHSPIVAAGMPMGIATPASWRCSTFVKAWSKRRPAT